MGWDEPASPVGQFFRPIPSHSEPCYVHCKKIPENNKRKRRSYRCNKRKKGLFKGEKAEFLIAKIALIAC